MRWVLALLAACLSLPANAVTLVVTGEQQLWKCGPCTTPALPSSRQYTLTIDNFIGEGAYRVGESTVGVTMRGSDIQLISTHYLNGGNVHFKIEAGPGWFAQITPNGGKYFYTAPLGYVATIDGEFVAWGVPEPSVWALLLIGFGAVGGAMRRSNDRRSPALGVL